MVDGGRKEGGRGEGTAETRRDAEGEERVGIVGRLEAVC